jgi:hypothetical protein
MSTAKKNTPPPLSLPERPPSKVEAGLQAEAKLDPAVELIGDAAGLTPEQLRETAIDAMVAAGLTREFAEAAFVLNEDGKASAADVADAVSELEESNAPLCKHGCHGDSWAKQKGPRGEQLDAVGCEHGTFPRHPAKAE